MKNKKILVTGASIAGPTLAYWLNHYGFEVILAERAPELRLGGQNIDVKGPARQIAKKMGIEEIIRSRNTTETGLRFVNADNNTVAEFPKESALSMTQELEILRGDLVQILYESTKNDVDYRFGEYITALKQTEKGIDVSFFSGRSEQFDLVVSAEGIGSHTRNLVFGDQTEFNYLGLYTAYLTIPRVNSDSEWARWCNTKGGIVFLIRPDNYGSARASITFTAKEDEYKGLSIDEQKIALINRIKGSGWESERIIRGIIDAKDLYFDRISQVKAKKWSKGRVAIIGDAAYCATPIAGKGTDLAMAGAYILAGELFAAETHEQGFYAYECRMRPYVDKCHKLPPGIPTLVYPQSKTGVAILNFLLSVAASKPAKRILGFFGSEKKVVKEEIHIKDYGN